MKEEPYLLTSLIRRLTELLHEHGDLPVYTFDIISGWKQVNLVEAVSKNSLPLKVPKCVYID